jgi:hypothetical protein
MLNCCPSVGGIQSFARLPDTTQSAMIYDMSLLEAKGKYVVEINFENGRLSSFRRKQ